MSGPAGRGTLPPWLRDALVLDRAAYLPFVVDGHPAGWLRPEFAAGLSRFAGVFMLPGGRVEFDAALPHAGERGAALAGVLERLRSDGFIRGWRDELYAIHAQPGGPELLRFERSAAKLFGFTGPASHLNGLVRHADGLHMWIATRSASKATEPGKLDNMVAGGNPAGLDELATLLKECAEEAGLPAPLAATAQRCGTVEFARAVAAGVDAQRIAVFDALLPAAFRPQNQDGEVAGFELLPVAEVRRRLSEPHAFTVDAALVAWDCLQRHGCS